MLTIAKKIVQVNARMKYAVYVHNDFSYKNRLLIIIIILSVNNYYYIMC